jgi:hypothetical protein
VDAIQTAIDQFARRCDDSEVASRMRPPATPREIQALERELAAQDRLPSSFAFPRSYRAFLQHFDGGCLDDPHGEWVTFLSVRAHDESSSSLRTHNAADCVLMDHQVETYFGLEPLVIIGYDVGSNFWALDPRYRRADGEMPVLFCDHETGESNRCAEDFMTFLCAIAERRLGAGAGGPR